MIILQLLSEVVSDDLNRNGDADQIEFIGLVVDDLTAQGVTEPGLLYEGPFMDVAPQGPEQVFDDAETVRLLEVIEVLNWSAMSWASEIRRRTHFAASRIACACNVQGTPLNGLMGCAALPQLIVQAPVGELPSELAHRRQKIRPSRQMPWPDRYRHRDAAQRLRSHIDKDLNR